MLVQWDCGLCGVDMQDTEAAPAWWPFPPGLEPEFRDTFDPSEPEHLQELIHIDSLATRVSGRDRDRPIRADGALCMCAPEVGPGIMNWRSTALSPIEAPPSGATRKRGTICMSRIG